MAYELKLQADTIQQLAYKVEFHHTELQTIINKPVIGTPGDLTHLSNEAAAHVLSGEDDNTTSHADVTGQLDKDGLPWDERIHSSNKKMTAKGIWTRRRGISDLQFDQTAAELKGGVQPVPAPYVPPFTVPVQNQFADISQPFTPAPLPQAPQNPYVPAQFIPPAPTPVQPVAPVPQPAPQAYGIQDLFNKIQPMFAANVEQAQAYVNSLTQRLSTQFQMQVQSVNDIGGRPDMIAYAMQLMAAEGK